MATLGFLDPPKAPDQVLRERRHEDDPSAARTSRILKLVLWALGIAGLAVIASIVTVSVLMMQSKHAWLSTLRAQYAVESIVLVDGAGRSDAADCWTGSTVNLVVRLKNQKVYEPTTETVAVRLSGGPDSASGWWAAEQTFVEQTVVVPGTAMPKVDTTVDVPFAIEVPASMQGTSLTWTVLATGSGDEPPNRGRLATTVAPCAQGM